MWRRLAPLWWLVPGFVILAGCQRNVVAVVDGHRVTRDEVWAEMVRSGDAQRVLQNVIDGWLLEADARQNGIAVTEEEIQSIMALSEEKGLGFDAASSGMSDADLRAVLRRNLLIAKSVVTEEEARAFYDQQQVFFNDPKQVRLGRIVMADRDALAALRGRILAGEVTFADAARESSVDQTTKAQGGDWGWKDELTVSADLGGDVFAMQEGEITEPSPAVFPEGSWQIVQVNEIREAVERSYDEVAPFVRLVMVLNAPPNSNISQDMYAYFEGLWGAAQVRIRDARFQNLQRFYDERRASGGAPQTPSLAPGAVDVPEELEGYIPGSPGAGGATPPGPGATDQ